MKQAVQEQPSTPLVTPNVVTTNEVAPRPQGLRPWLGRWGASRSGYVVSRLLLLVPGVLVAAAATFFLITLIPSDPIGFLLGDFASPAQIAAKEAELGLDRPLGVRFLDYLGGIATGDFGTSYRTGQPVLGELLGRVPSSLILTVPGFLLARFIGIRLGILQATSRRPGVVRGVVTFLQATPSFVAAVFGILLLVVMVKVLPPPAGQIGLGDGRPPHVTGTVVIDALLAGQVGTFFAALPYLVLPVLVLGLMLSVPFARITASTIRANLDADFTVFGRANGLPRRRVLSNAKKSARSSVITVSGIVAAELVGGTVIVERIFSWNGTGNWALEAIVNKDLPAVMAFVIFMTVTTMVVYLVADVLSVLMDPRMK